MNFSIETLFLQHLSDLERLRHSVAHSNKLEWEIKFAMNQDCRAAAIGRSALVTEQLSVCQVSEADDFYRVACVLCSTGSPTDLALAHICTCRVHDLKKNYGAVLSSEFEAHLTSLTTDTWNHFVSSITPL